MNLLLCNERRNWKPASWTHGVGKKPSAIGQKRNKCHSSAPHKCAPSLLKWSCLCNQCPGRNPGHKTGYFKVLSNLYRISKCTNNYGKPMIANSAVVFNFPSSKLSMSISKLTDNEDIMKGAKPKSLILHY